MSSSIEQLKGLVSQKQGIARPNIFRVIMPSIGNTPNSEINLLCRAASLPGKQILSRDRVIGLERQKIANGYAVGDMSLSFLVLNDMGIKQYFDAWTGAVFLEDSYEVGYKNDYQMDIKVQLLRKGLSLPVYSTGLGLPTLPSELQNRLPRIGPFDLAQGQFDLDFITPDDILYEVTLYEAFPTTIDAIGLSNDPDGIAELSVQLSYTNWRATKVGTPSGNLGNILIGSLLNRILN